MTVATNACIPLLQPAIRLGVSVERTVRYRELLHPSNVQLYKLVLGCFCGR